MWILHCNLPIARRLTMCFVEDETGELRWSGKTVGAALRFLHENEINSFELHGTEDDERFWVTTEPVSTGDPPGA